MSARRLLDQFLDRRGGSRPRRRRARRQVLGIHHHAAHQLARALIGAHHAGHPRVVVRTRRDGRQSEGQARTFPEHFVVLMIPALHGKPKSRCYYCGMYDAAGFVLAGGRSRRMGADKALLAWHGATLVEHVARELAAVAQPITLVGPSARYAHLGLPVVEDLHPGLGPLAGIEAALASSSAPWNLILACDLPGVQSALLAAVLDAALSSPDLDCVTAVDADGRLQPLCAAYHRRTLPRIARQIEIRHVKLLDTIALLNYRTIAAGAAASLHNVNTPEDWRQVGGPVA